MTTHTTTAATEQLIQTLTQSGPLRTWTLRMLIAELRELHESGVDAHDLHEQLVERTATRVRALLTGAAKRRPFGLDIAMSETSADQQLHLAGLELGRAMAGADIDMQGAARQLIDFAAERSGHDVPGWLGLHARVAA